MNSTARFWRLVALMVFIAPILAACANNVGGSGVKRAAFTSKEFGVKVSPRVTKTKYPPRGGGRVMPLKTYKVRGVAYTPVAGPGYVARGKASWYGQDFHGRRTANDEIFGAYYLTAASPVLPIPSYARVTNLENGRSVMVRVNDRGPYMSGRIIDMSYQAAEALGYRANGSATVEVRYVGPAPLNADDNKMLMASLNRETSFERQTGSTMIAMAETPVPHSAPASRDPLSGGIIGDIINMFGYADTNQSVNGAIAATEAMASGDPALEEWRQSVDADALKVHVLLGVFRDQVQAITIAESFAMLGAVDEETLDLGGNPATRLTLTHLKPGVARADVVSLARQLGLSDV
ncbi:MAG: septal ring lytic transglycosylase RlpA family protein, partial [Devosia sp.]